MSGFSLNDLEAIVAERAGAPTSQSWTARLYEAGVGKAAQKTGEEAVETVIAAVSGSREELIAESADLFYHLLVTLKCRGVSVDEIMEELERRTGRSGLAEKAARAGS